MARFVQVQGKADYINVDKIRDFYQTQDKRVIITFDDGETRTIDFKGDNYAANAFIDSLRGTYEIKQILELKEKLFIVGDLTNDSGDILGQWAEQVHLLGLTYLGMVLPFSMSEGYFDIDENAKLVTEDKLKNYKIISINGIDAQKEIHLWIEENERTAELRASLIKIFERHHGDVKVFVGEDMAFPSKYNVLPDGSLFQELRNVLPKDTKITTNF